MLNNINELISSQLAKLIFARKLKDSEILRRCGFTRPTLAKIKSGGNINVETLAALASGLAVKIAYFVDEEVTEQYTASGPKAVAAKHIDTINQEAPAAPSPADACAPSADVSALQARVDELQQKLITAQERIIELQTSPKAPPQP